MTSALRLFRRFWRACLRGGALASVAAVAVAQPAPLSAGAETIDPPGRVARLADVSGQVWLFNPDTGEWVGAARNQPLTTGDRLATDAGARAELRVGSTTLRLDGGSELELLRVDDDRVSLQLHNGALAARLRSGEAVREFEVVTAEGRFTPTRTGRLRIDRHGDGSSLTVYGGEAKYEGPGSALTVYSNQRADFRLDGSGNAQYAITEPVRDSFAGWTADRDRADDRDAERRAGTRYVSPEMTGVEELDRHGVWEQDAEYGALWIPRGVALGWAPYSAGHWAWVRPWGWTWVDDAPWGFAPFHYGRWVVRQTSGRDIWCWAPGRYVARPVYAPALVGWVGNPGLNISISIGSRAPTIGWFPLAPREVYVPAYRVSPRYVREVNVTHVTNITNITTIVNNPQGAVAGIDYRNRRFPHALTTVPQSVLAQHQPVAPAALPWRGRPGDPTDRVQAAAELVAAPPPLVRAAEPGRRLEPGRPAWPRGGPGRPEQPPGFAGAPAPAPAAPVAAVAPVAPAAPAVPAPRDPRAMPAPRVPAPTPTPVEADGRRTRDPVERREERRDERRRDERRPVPPVAAAAPAAVAAPAAAAAAVAPPAPPVRGPTARNPDEPNPRGARPRPVREPAAPDAAPPPRVEAPKPAVAAAPPENLRRPTPRVEERVPGEERGRPAERRERDRERVQRSVE